MAVNIGTVEGLLRLRDEFSSVLSRASSQLAAHGERMQQLGRSMSEVGGQMTRSITLPIVGIGVAALKMSTDFNKSMANVGSLIPGNVQRVGELKRSVQEMSVAVGKSTQDLSGGLYQAISAFGDTNEVVKILEINARAAAAGVAETTEAINLTSGVTKAYGDTSAAAVQHAADLALVTVRLGQTTFPQLAEAMGRVTPIAQSLGQSQEDLFAVFATATGVTGSAAEVATQYRGVLAGLLKPTEDLAVLIKKLGYESGQAMLEQLGLVDTLRTITGTAEKSKRPITDFIAQIEAVPLALALAGPQADQFKAKLAEMGKAAGATDAAFEAQTNGVNKAGFAFEQANAKAAVLAQNLGDALAPALLSLFEAAEPLVRMLSSMVERFAALPEPARNVLIVIAGIAAAAGPAVYVLGNLITAWGSIVSIAPRVIAAVTSINIAIYGIVGVAIAAAAAINGLINKWKEASAAAIQYDVQTSTIEGRALKFAASVRATGQASSSAFQQATADAAELKAKIEAAEKAVRSLREQQARATPDARTGARPGEAAAVAQIKAQQRELDNLRAAYSRLVPALKGVKVVADAAGKSLDFKPPAGLEKPFNDLGIVLKEVGKDAKDLRAEFEGILGGQQTPRERLLADIKRLNELIAAGAGTAGEAAAALGRMADELERLDPLKGKGPLLDLTKLNAAEASEQLKNVGADARRIVGETTDALAKQGGAINALSAALALANKLFGEGSEQAKRIADELERARAAANGIDPSSISIQGGEDTSPEARRDAAVADINKQYQQIVDNSKRTAVDMKRIEAEKNRALTKINKEYRDSQIEAARAMADDFAAVANNVASVLNDLGVFNSDNPDGLPAWAQDHRAEGRGQIVNNLGGAAAGNPQAWWAIMQGLAKALTTRGGIHGGTEVTAGAGGSAQSLEFVTRAGERELLEHVQSLGDGITSAVNQALDAIGGQVESLNVKVTQKGQGWRVSVNDGFSEWFTDLDEAMNYAITEGIKGATISGLDTEVKQALEGSVATTFEGLFSDLEFGKFIADLGLDEAAAQLDATVSEFYKTMQRAIQLGIDTQKITAYYTQQLQEQREAILGIKVDPAEQLRRQIDAFNRQITLIDAEQKAKQASLLVQKAQLQAEVAVMGAEAEVGRLRIQGRVAVVRAEGELVQAELQVVAAMAAALAAIDAALASIAAVLAGLPALITDAEALAALGRLGRGSGGGQTKKEREQGVKDFIHEKELSFLPEMQQRLARINDEYAEQLKNAGGNVKLQEKLNELKKKELELIGKGIKDDLIKPYLGRPGQQSDFARQMEEIQKAYEDARAVAKETGVAIWKLNKAERERMRLLGLQVQASLGIFSAQLALEIEETAKSLDFLKINAATLGLTAEQVAAIMAEVSTGKFLDIGEAMAKQLGDEKLLAEFAEMRYDIQKAQWALEIEMLKEKGILLEAQYLRLKEILGRLPENLPGAGANNRQQIQELYAQRLADNARAIAEAADRWLESTKKLLDYQKSLALSSLSVLSPTERIAEAQRQYQENLAAALRGDIGARERFQQVADQLLGEGRSAFASSEAYTTLFAQVQADLQRLISAPQPGTYRDGNVVYGAFEQAIGPVAGALADTGPIAQRLGDTGPTVNTIRGSGALTVNSINSLHAGVRDGLTEVKDALRDPGNAALIGQLSRVADGLESYLRQVPPRRAA